MNTKKVDKPTPLLVALACTAGIMLVTNWALAQERSIRNERALVQLDVESIHILGGFRNPIVRWSSTVNFAIVGNIRPSTIQKITAIFNEISLMTGIRYHQVDHALSKPDRYLEAIGGSQQPHLTLCGRSASNNCANFVVLVVNQELMHNIALSLPLKPVYQQATARKDNIHCFFSPTVTSSFEITHSIVWVRNDLEVPMLDTCLQEEIYQSFGLFNDYSNSHYYSFNNVVAPKKITAFDKQLLTSLYDAGFSTGTSILPVAIQLSAYYRAKLLRDR